MEVTYENIKSLIVSQEQDGMMIKLKFQAEGQTTPIETVAVVMASQEEMMKNVMIQVAKAAAVGTGVGLATGAIGNAVGGAGGQGIKTAGSMAGSAAAAGVVNMDDVTKTEMTDEKTQQAIVTAFSGLSMYYKWEDGKWVYQQPVA